MNGMWTIESHIKGVNVGICCELDLGSGNLTSGSGSSGGKSIGGKSVTLSPLDDRVAGRKEETGGKDSDSVDDGIGSVYCMVDAIGGHQQ